MHGGYDGEDRNRLTPVDRETEAGCRGVGAAGGDGRARDEGRDRGDGLDGEGGEEHAHIDGVALGGIGAVGTVLKTPFVSYRIHNYHEDCMG